MCRRKVFNNILLSAPSCSLAETREHSIALFFWYAQGLIVPHVLCVSNGVIVWYELRSQVGLHNTTALDV